MQMNGKDPVLVVVQLTGGNDFMNTIIPYTNGIYYDSRKTVGIPEDEVLPFTDTLAFHPRTAPLKELYDMGKVAIVQGIGYPNSNRSHFRGMDIWHTCEPHRISTEGWLGKTLQEIDPQHENVLTGVSIGRGLPRAMAKAGVPVTSVAELDNYGMMTGIEQEQERLETLDLFKELYTPAVGSGLVMDYLSQTGLDVLKGADIIKKAPQTYQSTVDYPNNPIAKSLRDVARVHFADLGTRIFYTQHGGYDTHANEVPTHPRLVDELSGALRAFMQDLWEHDAAEEVAILVFTEFGRRVRDNGSGTDHGSGGGAFLIGERIKGGLYAEYPSLEPSQQLYGEDLRHTFDYRGVYATLLEQWLEVEAAPIVGGTYEQLQPFNL